MANDLSNGGRSLGSHGCNDLFRDYLMKEWEEFGIVLKAGFRVGIDKKMLRIVDAVGAQGIEMNMSFTSGMS